MDKTELHPNRKTLLRQGSIAATPAHPGPLFLDEASRVPHPLEEEGAAGRTVDLRLRLRPCSEVGRGLGRFLPSLASNGPASFLPDGEAVAGADLLGVLEKASGAGDDATGQPLS